MKKITLFFALLLFTAFNYTAQAAESQSAACTAGNLATVAASYLTTVTNLTVTGTIDARDFKTMRDAMPLLAVINLSGCTVAAYTGTKGTEGTTSISYPANGIPNYAFNNPSTGAGKTSLKTFNYPSSVTTIGNYAFSDCNGLSGSLTIPSSVTTIGDWAFLRCNGFTGSLTIPSSVKSIGDYAFIGCIGFTGSLTIPSSVTTIGDYAFSSCSGLTGSLTIPSSVTSIEARAFSGCSGFTGSLTIPSSVKTIGSGAFSDCSGFTGSLTIPSSVTSIGNYAFSSCNGFTGSLTIPSSVTSIGNYAFNSCNGFTGSLTIPSSVTSIGAYTFYWCSGLTGSLTIPSSVTSIGASAFWGCTGLTSIYANSPTPINISASQGVFYYINKTTCILYVPVGKKALYAAANQWKDFINIIEGFPTSLNEVSSSAISIYPNPATSYITISELGGLVGDKTVTLSVVDVSGTTLMVREVEPITNPLNIDVSALKNGIYFITVQTSNGSFVKRFVKE